MPTAVIMPKFEMAQETGTVGRWLVEEGAAVAKGDPILEVETDKVTMDVEAPADGILRGITAAPGQVIPIGQTIAYILKPNETLPGSPPLPGRPTLPGSPTPVAARVAAAHNLDLAGISGTGPAGRITRTDVETHLAAPRPAELLRPGDVARPRDMSAADASAKPAPKPIAVPAARRLARELGIDLATVTGTGPRGRIQSADIHRSAKSMPAEIPAELPVVSASKIAIARTIPLTAIRRTTAERMTASVREIPQFTLAVDADMTRTQSVLDDLRSAGDVKGDAPPKVTLTALLVKACAYALSRHPGVNASFEGDHIIEWADVNIGIATSANQGLLVPVIHHADRHGLHELARRLADLGERARSGRLRLPDLQGGTFTLSNLGMYGIDHFTAIVNPPQAAILAVGRVAQRPVVAPDGTFVARPLAALTLTADHRVLDGAGAAAFLNTVQAALEHPGLLLA